MTEHVDVVVVGAGISGVSAAWHLQDRCPTKSYAILEKREAMGGTWDLFRYPGIRSDSDMYTLGFRFRPWTDHPPATLARGSRLRRQEHRRDRQRCHRGHFGSGAGEFGGQARDDAAALTDLHRLAARRGHHCRAAQPLATRESGIRRGSL